MGGLILAAALTGTKKKDTGTSIEKGWPPYLYVANVVTISPPFNGGRFWPGVGCSALAAGKEQCQETTGGSEFLKWLIPNPQGAQGTDWTLIGTDDDDIVESDSALSWHGAGHYVQYLSGIFPYVQFIPGAPDRIDQPLEHSDQTNDINRHPNKFWNYYDPKWIEQRGEIFNEPLGVSIIDTVYAAICNSSAW